MVNKALLPDEILEKYREEQGFPVKDDILESDDFVVLRRDLLSAEEFRKPSSDALRRSLIRHDPDKLAREVVKIIKSQAPSTKLQTNSKF